MLSRTSARAEQPAARSACYWRLEGKVQTNVCCFVGYEVRVHLLMLVPLHSLLHDFERGLGTPTHRKGSEGLGLRYPSQDYWVSE